MQPPPNLSKDVTGFNSKMFNNDRAVRRGFRILGYDVDNRDHKVPSEIVRQFQIDYNKCANRFGRWGALEISAEMDKNTLNALEHAINWSKKTEDSQGASSIHSWQSLCVSLTPGSINHSDKKFKHKRRDCSQAHHEGYPTNDSETNFVEVLKDGSGKLRNIHTGHALRCNILNFEKHGCSIFATVEIPPQADLPGGRSDSMTCPCVFAR